MNLSVPRSIPELLAVHTSDFEDMVTIRIEALRESLTRLGRFDAARARERLASAFVPAHMRHIDINGERAGFITLLPPHAQATKLPKSSQLMRLEHLYLRPAYQNLGYGAWALNWAKSQAAALGCGVALSGLKLSNANRFYLRHGFKQVGESEFDIDYCWVTPQGASA
jgi:GNAT superfamily N-acetyltransferase